MANHSNGHKEPNHVRVIKLLLAVLLEVVRWWRSQGPWT
jgi:hypothetical protein